MTFGYLHNPWAIAWEEDPRSVPHPDLELLSRLAEPAIGDIWSAPSGKKYYVYTAEDVQSAKRFSVAIFRPKAGTQSRTALDWCHLGVLPDPYQKIF